MRVRILVWRDDHGNWRADGRQYTAQGLPIVAEMDGPVSSFIVTAEIPDPAPPVEVEGAVGASG